MNIQARELDISLVKEISDRHGTVGSEYRTTREKLQKRFQNFELTFKLRRYTNRYNH